MKIKKFFALLLAMTLCMGVFSVNAYAYVDESAAAESQPVQEEAVLEETPEPEPTEEPMEALTPDGNLTIVDDNGSPTGAGKQFITLVSKNGNYFYLIIDRDDEGEQTVHFLNQVDEADLLSLMDEDAAAQYQESLEVETEPETPETAAPAPEPEPVEEPEEKSTNMLPIIVLLAAVLAGGGGFLFLQMKKKKQAEQTKPDPDADYTEDEDDDFELPDEDEVTDGEEIDSESGEDDEQA